MPPTCVLLHQFAIGARVALLWQHSANACQRVLVLALCLANIDVILTSPHIVSSTVLGPMRCRTAQRWQLARCVREVGMLTDGQSGLCFQLFSVSAVLLLSLSQLD